MGILLFSDDMYQYNLAQLLNLTRPNPQLGTVDYHRGCDNVNFRRVVALTFQTNVYFQQPRIVTNGFRAR